MKVSVKLFLTWITFFIMGSCTVVKPYERIYVDDAMMQMGVYPGQAFEYYVETIREGGVSAGGGKSGGGCGCN